MARNMDNRSLRERFFGFVFHGYNDNFDIRQLKAAIAREEKNLEGRQAAVAKYERYAVLYAKYPTIRDQSLQMATVEREAIPQITKHLNYLRAELKEEEAKADA